MILAANKCANNQLAQTLSTTHTWTCFAHINHASNRSENCYTVEYPMIAGCSLFTRMLWTKVTVTHVRYLLAVTYDMFCFSVVHLLWPPSFYMIDGFGGKHNSICVDLQHSRVLCDQNMCPRLQA